MHFWKQQRFSYLTVKLARNVRLLSYTFHMVWIKTKFLCYVMLQKPVFLQSFVRPQKSRTKEMATGFTNSAARGFLLKMLALQFSKEKWCTNWDLCRLQNARCKICGFIYFIILLLAVCGHLWYKQAMRCSISSALQLHRRRKRRMVWSRALLQYMSISVLFPHKRR